ncbi:NAD(P)/FAD-dependent oxidoreductase [Vreelandella populi]|uniref:FAD-dependent oxidoreductase n=1 Tax=Vreelandella populi TaxID=2498858 RepID=A0A3S0YNZ2_9GAMM|nr:FAD-dependent oxidoreductase [Halomonas populi]RUR35700.1 FAD-dependent oxidoreductase [Halomonas populi]RUR47891.1 FAD-dependent oxidoreductase [Halomonas populi]RUR54263.1 FAD-dependent oxidoreductase [Halomonas populi]
MPVSHTLDATDHAGLVIIGTGMAGVGLARALRRLNDRRAITLISLDSGDDYSKPLLSTGLTKHMPPERLVQRTTAALADELDARVITHTHVEQLTPEVRTIRLSDGQALGYDTLVLATGAAPQAPFAIPDSVSRRFFTVNNLDEYRRFRAALDERPARVAVIGAGLVGCEFANDLHVGGHQVTLIAPETTPLARLLPEPLGTALGCAFQDAGIQLALGRTLADISAGSDSPVRLTLGNHATLDVDLVLLATGLAPRIALADAAGLAVSRHGITVDRYLRTSDPHIHALGDAACVAGVNAMYVQPLQASAKALAATLAGTPTQVSFGAWPIIVKTPLLPVVAYPPAVSVERWRIEGEGSDMSALAEDKHGNLVGFALTGGCVRRKVELSRASPALLG